MAGPGTQTQTPSAAMSTAWLDELFARSWTTFSRVLFEQYNELVAKTHLSIPNVPPQYALVAMLLLGTFLLLSGAQLIQLSGFGAGFMLGVVFLARTIGVAVTDMMVSHFKLQQHAATVLAVTTVLCGLIGAFYVSRIVNRALRLVVLALIARFVFSSGAVVLASVPVSTYLSSLTIMLPRVSVETMPFLASLALFSWVSYIIVGWQFLLAQVAFLLSGVYQSLPAYLDFVRQFCVMIESTYLKISRPVVLDSMTVACMLLSLLVVLLLELLRYQIGGRRYQIKLAAAVSGACGVWLIWIALLELQLVPENCFDIALVCPTSTQPVVSALKQNTIGTKVAIASLLAAPSAVLVIGAVLGLMMQDSSSK